MPILDTLKPVCEDKSVKQNWLTVQGDRSGYNDIQDGQVFKHNPFFKENLQGLQLIIFQDSFEVVNPLGVSRVNIKCWEFTTHWLILMHVADLRSSQCS